MSQRVASKACRWALMLAAISLVSVTVGCAPAAREHTAASVKPGATATRTVALKVDGLDDQAQAKLDAELRKLGAVQRLRVDVNNGVVWVTFQGKNAPSDQQLLEGVKRAGYTPQKIVKAPLEISQLEKSLSGAP